MSHSVTITRTTTTTSSTAILLNTGYLKTAAGLLKLFQTILGAICVGLVGNAIDRYGLLLSRYSNTTSETLFYLLMVTTFFITTALLLISCIISFLSASMIHKTIFEVIYHVVGFGLLLAAGIVFLIEIKNNDREYYYNTCLAAAIIAIVNSVLYLFSTILAYRTYRGAGL
ncbi:hypothetical protein C0J52_16389 [Blattella germanica]|nr:hypothetical protein C0J52_16389 [Blattella germanica]PSN42067.1 hypothetical protein C0J52_16389 [Blattella germanica]